MTFLQNISPMDLENLLAADRALVCVPGAGAADKGHMSLREANWAFLARQVCRMVGITPVSDGEREKLRMAGKQPLPFLGPEQFMDAEEMRRKSLELLRPLEQFLQKYLSGETLSREKLHLAMKPTWQDIVSGTAFQSNNTAARNWVGYHTSTEMLRKMEGELGLVYRQIHRNMGLFAREYGFPTLSRLYRGICVANGERTAGPGLGDMVRMLRDHVNPRTGYFRPAPDARHFYEELREYEMHLREEDARGLIGRMLRQANGREEQMIDEWVLRYENLFRAQVVERYRAVLLGQHGLVERLILEPLDRFMAQMHCFGCVVDTVSRAYEAHGAVWDDYAHFCAATGGEMDRGTFEHRRTELGQYLAGVNVPRFRDDLVGGFFGDPESWLLVEEELIARGPCQQVRLRDGSMPVVARRRIDSLIRSQLLPGDWE